MWPYTDDPDLCVNLYYTLEHSHKKKKECAELAAEINQLKKEIDKVRMHTILHMCMHAAHINDINNVHACHMQERQFLEEHKTARQQQNVVPLMTDSGDPILDEAEFSTLTRLKEVHAYIQTQLADSATCNVLLPYQVHTYIHTYVPSMYSVLHQKKRALVEA